MILTDNKTIALSEKVCQALKDRIVSGKYPPKTMLSEKEICDEFSVSRTPFREAIKKLEELRLVEVVPRFGTYVSQVNLHEVRDALEVRCVLEPLAARLAAERIKPEQLHSFESLIKEGEDVIRNNGSILLRSRLDKRCHDHISEAAHNGILTAELDRLRLICTRIYSSSFREEISVPAIVGQWGKIYGAVKAKDSEAAGEFMTEHMKYTVDHLRKEFF
ncbi:MAG TPA: GntR family transcriptional regulator [Syntrophorhabdaceae bacterium]|nr:GntR family transcriptional regulator [Syntrophorhabdaceae bacterium]